MIQVTILSLTVQVPAGLASPIPKNKSFGRILFSGSWKVQVVVDPVVTALPSLQIILIVFRSSMVTSVFAKLDFTPPRSTFPTAVITPLDRFPVGQVIGTRAP